MRCYIKQTYNGKKKISSKWIIAGDLVFFFFFLGEETDQGTNMNVCYSRRKYLHSEAERKKMAARNGFQQNCPQIFLLYTVDLLLYSKTDDRCLVLCLCWFMSF